MKTYKELEQRSDEWFALRLGKATGSIADKLMSDSSPFKTLVMQKAAEIINGVSAENNYFNADMERGIEMENIARSIYELGTGNIVETMAFIEHSEYAGFSPDGLVGDDGMIEIKCPKINGHLSNILGKINSSYKYQMQFGMFCSDRKWCDFVSYNAESKRSSHIIRVERDEKIQEKIALKLKKFEEEINKIIAEYNAITENNDEKDISWKSGKGKTGA